MERAEMDYDVYVGVDVGKTKHYAVALDGATGKRLFSRPFGQDEASIRELLEDASGYGKALVTVDQFGNIGRLVVAVGKDMGLDVAHITPKDFKDISTTYKEGKSDAKDAFIIADVSLSTPRLIRPVGTRDGVIAEIKVLNSRRADIVKERTRYYNRLHDLLLQASPPLEQLFEGEKLHSGLAVKMFERYGGPRGLKRAGKARVSKWAGSVKCQKNRGPAMAEEVFEALGTMTVELPATEVIEIQIKQLARRILELDQEESELDAAIEERADAVPETAILKSIPGIGRVHGATIAAEIGDISRFPDANHLASYGGIAPVKEESGTSVKKNKRRKSGNRRLKNALIQSAQMAIRFDPRCKAYYNRKRAEGLKRKQALRALARRRVDLIYALLANGTFYEPSHRAAA
ncbi:MAG: IS110 family transposase [Gordonibacter urolithinfaciens]